MRIAIPRPSMRTTLRHAPVIAAALSAAAIGTMGAPARSQTAVATPVLQVPTGRGKLVTLSRPMSDLFVADPTIADVQVRSPTQLYIFGKKSGETTLSATARGGAVVYAATIRVGNNIDSIGSMLGLAMPDARIVATPMNGMVLLTGAVANPQDAAEAERLVQAFVGADTKVLSRLKTATPLQVNLRVRFAEVSRSFVKNIGVNLTNRATGSTLFSISQGRQGTISTVPGNAVAGYVHGAPVDASGNPIPITASGLNPGATLFTQPATTGIGSTLGIAGHLLGADILSSLDLGETIGQVSTLAEPNVTTLSGETATFLAGGEIPIPVSQGLGAVSIEYKQYGVSLAYTPTVLANGRISLRVRPEVSQLTSSGAVTISGTTIPALSTRRIETSAELGSGESLVIGGLLQNDHNNSITKTPGIGDVPVLGALFRSNAFQRNETELVVVITPYLVKPVNDSDIVLPTDGYQAPTDLERVFLGALGGGKSGGERPKPTIAPAPAGPGSPVQPSIGALAPVLPTPSTAPAADPKNDRRARKDRNPAPAAPGFSSN
ncbi:MAG: type II and III secretion system protein family protein [Janthinobacterium lividum]